MTEISTVWFALVDWLANGLWADATWWQVLLVTLVMTHITISAVTIFLWDPLESTCRHASLSIL